MARQDDFRSEPAEVAADETRFCSCVRDCASTLKVLADANRVLILRSLIRGPRAVGDICDATGLPQSRVSHHLGRMRLAGVVEAHRDGRHMIYRINPDIAAEDGLDLGCCHITFRRVPDLSGF